MIEPNFRPGSNLAYASILIENAFASQLVERMTNNGLFEQLQSAYRQGHSTETALLKVQNDMLVVMDSLDSRFSYCLIYLLLSIMSITMFF